jgi:hypothetical protein
MNYSGSGHPTTQTFRKGEGNESNNLSTQFGQLNLVEEEEKNPFFRN